jgi:hypothetical protein
MTLWTKATTSDKGRRVTIEDASGYLVSVSSACPALSWAEAWTAYDRAVSGQSGKVAG